MLRERNKINRERERERERERDGGGERGRNGGKVKKNVESEIIKKVNYFV